MQRRVTITICSIAVYIVLSMALGATAFFVTWQSFMLLAPPFILYITLAWITSYPDFSKPISETPEPIEDFNNPSRKVIWLNGPWEFQIEQTSRWHRFLVPMPWNVISGMEHFDGTGYFRRVFTIPDGWSQGCIFLNFRGVNYRAEVSIDGRKVGEHNGGFTPFSFEVTDRVCDSTEKELEVTVDNKLSQGTVPSVVGWNNDGGIFREVYLETRNTIHIEDIYVMSEPDLKGRADIAVIAKIHNIELEPKPFVLEVYSPHGALIHEHKIEDWTMQTLQHRFTINFVSLWSPQSPALYHIKLRVDEPGGDEYEFDFGVKILAAGENGLLLNGEPLRIRGITRQEESPSLGRTQSLKLIRADLERIKSMGFNTVRLGAMPAHPATLDECDRLGLLVLQEVPVWNTLIHDLNYPGYQKAAESQLKEMLQRDRNHPCVAMWGLANRIESNRSEARWLIERLVGIARGLDDRMVYLLSNNPGRELCADLVDCVIVNTSNMPGDGLKVRTKELNLGPATLIYHRGVAAYRKHGSPIAGAPGTEENQVRFCLDFIDTYDKDENLAGWIMPALTDFRDPGNIGGTSPFISSNGLLKQDRSEKPACGIVSSRLKSDSPTTASPVRSSRFPITSFSKSASLVFFAAILITFMTNPGLYSKLFYNSNAFSESFHQTWKVLAGITLFSSLSWAVLAIRFFHIAPRRIMGAIDMPYFTILAKVFQTSFTLFIFSYLWSIYFWVFDSTILHLAFRNGEFSETLSKTGALCLPLTLFALPAFFRIRIRYIFVAIPLWLMFLAYTSLGFAGAFIYTIIGPAIFAGIPIALIEWKFRVFKFLRKALDNPITF